MLSFVLKGHFPDLNHFVVVVGLQELQDLRAEGHEEEARGVRERLGSSPGPRRAGDENIFRLRNVHSGKALKCLSPEQIM
jgi:hypothetical protein